MTSPDGSDGSDPVGSGYSAADAAATKGARRLRRFAARSSTACEMGMRLGDLNVDWIWFETRGTIRVRLPASRWIER